MTFSQNMLDSTVVLPLPSQCVNVNYKWRSWLSLPLTQLFPMIIHFDSTRITDATHNIVDSWWRRNDWWCWKRRLWIRWRYHFVFLANNHFDYCVQTYSGSYVLLKVQCMKFAIWSWDLFLCGRKIYAIRESVIYGCTLHDSLLKNC